MKRDITKVLEEFFGDDQEALEKFAEGVDGINRTIKTDGLISRAKAAKKAAGPGDKDEEDDETEDDDQEDGESDEDQEDDVLELDDEAIAQVAKQVVASPAFAAIQQAVEKMTASVNGMIELQQSASKDVATLKKESLAIAKRVAALAKDDTERVQQLAEDMPSNRRRKVGSYRPRDAHAEDNEDGEDPDDLDTIAKRTLKGLPSYNNA